LGNENKSGQKGQRKIMSKAIIGKDLNENLDPGNIKPSEQINKMVIREDERNGCPMNSHCMHYGMDGNCGYSPGKGCGWALHHLI